ncbi:ATP-dependent zinc protease family protein [Zhongshania arctica]|uniref:ATP-dependent zinc protease n=1 Tax=Zhongshania arctica TaxID=3238302 RepID=A0ABV3TV33_9GAMM|tara:strand:- start:4895 stop:5359 length:465 start_codon:yes stop_codon:yes gene_type:complete
MTKYPDKILVGALELCDIPELGITDLQMRVDTGAATSSLHVDNIEEFVVEGKRRVRFDIHPDVHNVEKIITATAPLSGKKTVKSSSADKEKRVVIKTAIKLGGETWKIKLTLTDRSTMTNLMLLGREAMKDRILVDPSEEFILTKDNSTAFLDS